ncbi:tryparedoxin-like isoform X1 [Biomphalaria pfeifferi]|uniref:Tryparedoxin-like isoform X1 n=1 Tax=Biomphalaria pfeifferi TaxID=112525 RepID=A0AAD8BKG8_BIOPF|nr:tryparedoxin-like isoform X1 [Biomphalaria pfeifferi]
MSKNSLPRPSKKHRSDSKKKASVHPLEKLLGEGVLNAKGDSVSPTTFAVQEGEDGVLALYFSAHWCPPCKIFTPRLAMFYDELKGASRRFEVVFVSFDYNEASFHEYFSRMPWYAIDYSNSDKRDSVASEFGIKGIPVLIFLDAASFQPITLNGREIVMLDPRGDHFPWRIPLENIPSHKNSISRSDKTNASTRKGSLESNVARGERKESVQPLKDGEQSSIQEKASKHASKPVLQPSIEKHSIQPSPEKPS